MITITTWSNFILTTLITVVRNDGMIYCCGNGGSSAETDHLVSEFVTHGIRAVSLNNPATITALANDYSYKTVFSRQVKVMGRPGDLLIGLTTSGKSKNVLNAYKQAKKQKMIVVDWPRVGKDTAEIQENQLKLMHKVYKKVVEYLDVKNFRRF